MSKATERNIIDAYQLMSESSNSDILHIIGKYKKDNSLFYVPVSVELIIDILEKSISVETIEEVEDFVYQCKVGKDYPAASEFFYTLCIGTVLFDDGFPDPRVRCIKAVQSGTPFLAETGNYAIGISKTKEDSFKLLVDSPSVNW
jgi:hypothetical protein